jgi:hypothetical protein
VEDLGGQVLRLLAITNAMRDVRVDALEVSLVQLAEPSGITLRRLDQQFLVCTNLQSPQVLSRRGELRSTYIMLK